MHDGEPETREGRRRRRGAREAVVDADAALLTEYRGLDVAAAGRSCGASLREAGGELQDLQEHAGALRRPRPRPRARRAAHRTDGDRLRRPATSASRVAKALRDFAKTNPTLVVKGGVLGDKLLSRRRRQGARRPAAREELLAQLAGAMAAPLQQFAGLLAGRAPQLRLRPPGAHRRRAVPRRRRAPRPRQPSPPRPPLPTQPTRPPPTHRHAEPRPHADSRGRRTDTDTAADAATPPRRRAEPWQPRKRSSTRSPA